jgi:hypothetical protein
VRGKRRIGRKVDGAVAEMNGRWGRRGRTPQVDSVRVSAWYAPVTCFGGFARFFFRPPFPLDGVQQLKLDVDGGREPIVIGEQGNLNAKRWENKRRINQKREAAEEEEEKGGEVKMD